MEQVVFEAIYPRVLHTIIDAIGGPPSKGNPGNVLRKRLSLYPRDLMFQSRQRSRVISTSKTSGAPRAPSMNLLHTVQLREHVLVPQRHEDDAMVNKSTQGALDRLFLTTSLSSDRNENPGILSSEGTFGPESTGRVPKRPPLSGGVSVSSRDAEEESVVGGEDFWRDYRVVWFGGSAHFP